MLIFDTKKKKEKFKRMQVNSLNSIRSEFKSLQASSILIKRNINALHRTRKRRTTQVFR